VYQLFYSTYKQQNKSNIKPEDGYVQSYFRLTGKDSDYLMSLLLILLNPTLVLIDHGHFQYNSISLGLMQMATVFLLKESNSKREIFDLVLASIFYCLALNYKQMELYHALPIFFYLLGICFKSNIFKNGFLKLVFIGLSAIFTFALLWLPFILNGHELVIQVLNRIFPFSRGLFEVF
jgi:alpha-1,3-glucosyltransferase